MKWIYSYYLNTFSDGSTASIGPEPSVMIEEEREDAIVLGAGEGSFWKKFYILLIKFKI